MTTRCNQCRRKGLPLTQFLSRNGQKFVSMCKVCRARYGGWSGLTLDERRAAIKPKARNGIGYMARLVLVSQNRKTGPMPVSMTDMKSYPTTCTFRNAGCYAEYGQLIMWWKRVVELGSMWRDFCADVAALPQGQLWRHNEAGDLPGLENVVDIRALAQLVRANRDRRGFTFTHKPLKRKAERDAVAKANAAGFTINLSADNLAEADRLVDLSIAPVVTVVPSDAPRGLRTPAGRKIVLCPAETHGMTCLDCELCAHATRKSIVAFRAHGQAKAIVSDLVQLRRGKAA